jgi:hypothetical protein
VERSVRKSIDERDVESLGVEKRAEFVERAAGKQFLASRADRRKPMPKRPPGDRRDFK